MDRGEQGAQATSIETLDAQTGGVLDANKGGDATWAQHASWHPESNPGGWPLPQCGTCSATSAGFGAGGKSTLLTFANANTRSVESVIARGRVPIGNLLTAGDSASIVDQAMEK